MIWIPAWLAWAQDVTNGNSALALYNTQSNTLHQVTSGFYNDELPVFDPDGKYLFFRTGRTFAPSYSDLEPTWVYVNSSVLAAVPLRRDILSPLAPRNDAEGDKPKDKKDNDKGKDEEKKKDKPKAVETATFNLGLFNIANGLIDSYQLRNNATNTTLTTPTVITSGVDEVIIALAGVAGSFPTLSEGTGWTLDATDSESGVAGSAVATIHKAAATAGNYTPTVNSTGSANYGMAAIALKGSSVPGIKARRLYDYENQSSEIRTLIATASDAAGTDSLTNKVVYWDASGTPQTIFTPSATSIPPKSRQLS